MLSYRELPTISKPNTSNALKPIGNNLCAKEILDSHKVDSRLCIVQIPILGHRRWRRNLGTFDIRQTPSFFQPFETQNREASTKVSRIFASTLTSSSRDFFRLVFCGFCCTSVFFAQLLLSLWMCLRLRFDLGYLAGVLELLSYLPVISEV